MRIVAFIISLILLIYFGFKTAKILIFDLNMLTPYGYGYLTGSIIFTLLFGFIAYKTRPKFYND